MLIESIIRRKKGTQVILGDHRYDFQPDKDGRHVADVKLPSHLGTLLSIKEGYRLAQIEEVAEAVAAVALEELAEEVAPEPEAPAEPVIETPKPAPTVDLSGLQRSALAELYEAKFATAPPQNMKVAAIAAAIRDAA
jgi:hypothetical protein